MSYEFYKILHVVGLMMVFSGLGALLVGSKLTAVSGTIPLRKVAGLMHGLGLVVMLVAGFGLLARLGMVGDWPSWVYGKLVIWLVIGASIAVVRRLSGLAVVWWIVLLVLGGLGGLFGTGKA